MTLTIDKVDAQEYDQRNTEEGISVLEKDALGPANSRIPVTICWPPSTLHQGLTVLWRLLWEASI